MVVGADTVRMAQQTAERSIVHIVDDDESLRRAVDSLCRSIGLLTQTYASAQEFLDAKREDLPGCLVLDVRLPGISGLDFQSQLTELGIQLPVILVTGHGDIPMSVRAMKAGAVDFLAKPFRDQDMLDAVAHALTLDAERLATERSLVELRTCYDSLTPREREVMGFVLAGLMNKQIASAMGLSEITVKIHRGHVMKKMASRSVADLVRKAGTLHIDPHLPKPH
jgi:FixJ family two-component response regulator